MKLTITAALILLSYCSTAQINQEVNRRSSWLTNSEQVLLSDSVINTIQQEAKAKQVPAPRLEKNMVFFKALFNPNFSVSERIAIADYILEEFSEYAHSFPLDVVKQTKLKLDTQKGK